MVLSGYIIKIPYWIAWQVMRLAGKLDDLVFYVESEHDYFVIRNILPHIKYPYVIAAKNRAVAKRLEKGGINNVAVWPVFPRVLMMARHAFHRFPVNGIKKIGIKHGPYYFKKMISAKKYNLFDLFIFPTTEEKQMAESKGVTCGVAGGIPRIDTFFQPQTRQLANHIMNDARFDPAKKTLMFTATWDRSGLSAVDLWINHLDQLTQKYNVIVSLHPMMSARYFDLVKRHESVFFAESENLPAFMLVADFLISDTSSVMAEFCALNKPVITFAVKEGRRLTREITKMIQDISVQIESVEDLEGALEIYKEEPALRQKERLYWTRIFFGDINQSHGEKTARVINDFLKEVRKKKTSTGKPV